MSATPACEHVFVKCFPSGPRDNNEYFMACRKCGAEPTAEADPAPSSPAPLSLDLALEYLRNAERELAALRSENAQLQKEKEQLGRMCQLIAELTRQ